MSMDWSDFLLVFFTVFVIPFLLVLPGDFLVLLLGTAQKWRSCSSFLPVLPIFQLCISMHIQGHIHTHRGCLICVPIVYFNFYIIYPTLLFIVLTCLSPFLYYNFLENRKYISPCCISSLSSLRLSSEYLSLIVSWTE